MGAKKGDSEKGKTGKGRVLSGDEKRLWRSATQDVKKLQKDDVDEEEAEIPLLPVAPARPVVLQKQKTALAAPVNSKISRQPPQLDGNTDLKLQRGKLRIEGTLDLHGYNQEQAHRLLNQFVLAAHAGGKRCILVITGKGGRSKPREGRFYDDAPMGVLKEKLPQWVSIPPLRDIVLKLYPAAPKDGGSGAWYLYLKRDRGPSL
ncbi:MAG: DNA mismatch repair protein MutS [Micavibrio aeruginosavorus]|uniref:DNA mismatch repair protein MutS n=1 Tax=Micavibrio aeruginosavorus TaxID=349221 RepID=A0A2W5N680_9BACT|nr:MAG: DNA mismatch repair protein MutS [Micavibrio aeruginosavorus]